MSSLFLRSTALGPRGSGWRRARGAAFVVLAAGGVLGLTAMTALAPPPSATAGLDGSAASAALAGGVQELTVPAGEAPGIVRDGYSSTPGVATIAAPHTNRAWATLVLYFADFPMTESNITVMLRWMRQENGPDSWWLRNNPLNNGWGSGGGSGLGSYDSLVIAAENAAEALLENSGYSAIRAGFAAGAPSAEIEAAIWASPWASSHYANGAHWSYTPVPVVVSPAETWG